MSKTRWYLKAFLVFQGVGSLLTILIMVLPLSYNFPFFEIMIRYRILAIITNVFNLHWVYKTWYGGIHLKYYKKILVYSLVVYSLVSIPLVKDYGINLFMYFIIQSGITGVITYYLVRYLVLKSAKDVSNGNRITIINLKKNLILVDEFLSWIVCSLIGFIWKSIKSIFKLTTKKEKKSKDVVKSKPSITEVKNVVTKKKRQKIVYKEGSREYDLSKKTIVILREMAKSLGLKNLSLLRKDELINIICKKQDDELKST